MYFFCSYLGADVELTEERLQHITAQRPELNPDLLKRVLADPDQVLAHENKPEQRLFCRTEPQISGGKQVVVVVVSETERARHWIITAYNTRRIRRKGETLWSRPD